MIPAPCYIRMTQLPLVCFLVITFVGASSSLLNDFSNLHLVHAGSRSSKLSSFLSQNDSIASCVFTGNPYVDASSVPLDNSVLCYAYAGSQSVGASFLPFQDELILSQVFTKMQSINTRSSASQDNLINSWMCAGNSSTDASFLRF